MNESILTSIKKLLGIAEEYTHFDQDIVIYINRQYARSGHHRALAHPPGRPQL